MKDYKEIEKQLNIFIFSTIINTQLSNSNRPNVLMQANFLSKITSVNTNISDIELIEDFEFKVIDINDNADLIITLFTSKADKN